MSKGGLVPFKTNATGSYTEDFQPWTVKVYRKTNNSLLTNVNVPAQMGYRHNRAGLKSNPITLLDGILPWRNPSSYQRHACITFIPNEGSWNCDSPTVYVKDSKPNPSWARSQWSAAEGKPSLLPQLLAWPVDVMSFAEFSRLKNEATTKALNDLASAKANMGENLATLSQTAHLFADIAESALDLFRFYKQLKSGRISKFPTLNARLLKRLVRERKVERKLANAWLGYWYGLKPLAQDAYGLYEVLNDLGNGPPLLVHGRGRAMVEQNGSVSTDPPSAYPAPGYVHSYKCLAQVQCSITGRYESDMRQLNRIGMINPIALAWELTPFSFVVDWGVPVGQVLSAMTATTGLSFVGASTTARLSTQVSSELHPRYQRNGETHEILHRSFGFERVAHESWPRPGFYSKTFYKGASRFATIAALISNLTR